MSRYDWEAGTLKLPTAAWTAFKRGMQEGVKKLYAHDYDLMVKLHAALVEQKKGKRGFDLKAAFEAEVCKSTRSFNYRWGGPETTLDYDFYVLEDDDVRRMIFGNAACTTLRKPQKKDVPVINTSTLTFSEDEMRIKLDNATRTVHYHFGDNNYQVERARETAIARLFFDLLSKVTWTRGTGGKLLGNDEYNRESRAESRGGNYVTAQYGPLGQASDVSVTRTRIRKAPSPARASGK